MGNAQWVLELALILLLAATLFHALRLERALGVLKRDRGVLEGLVEGFNESTRQAESGIERLRAAADGAGRQMARQIDSAQLLRDELNFLTDRSDRLAERLEAAIRSARMFADANVLSAGEHKRHSSSATTASASVADPAVVTRMPRQLADEDESQASPRLRSQAERDLLRALRGASQ